MPRADTLTLVHHDDRRTTYTDVTYRLHRDAVRVWTAGGETLHTDILMTQAYRRRVAGPGHPADGDHR